MRLQKNMALRVLSTATFLAMVASCVTPAFAATYYIEDYKDGLLVEARDDGKVYVNNSEDTDGNVVIEGGKQSQSKENQTGEEAVVKEKETADKTQNGTAGNTGTEDNKKQVGTLAENKTPGTSEDTSNQSVQEKKEQSEKSSAKNTNTEDDDEKPNVKSSAAEEEKTSAAGTQADKTENKAADDGLKSVIKIVNQWTDKVLDVTLKNVKINVTTDEDKKGSTGNADSVEKYGYAALAVTGDGDTTIHLEGANELKSGVGRAGIEKNDSECTGKLTVTAEDTDASLIVTGGTRGAGIGGRQEESSSGLVIAGGKITAKGGNTGAGIGGGRRRAGEVTITGGDVTAKGGSYAAGIGGGSGSSGKVTITNGKVTASSAGYGTAIGAGNGPTGSGDVTILGGEVTTEKYIQANNNPTTGIGGSPECTQKSTIRILGGVVNALGNGYAAAIGAGSGNAQVAEIEIGGGAQVTAKGGPGNSKYGAGAAIGTAGSAGNVAGTEADVSTAGMTTGSITRLDATQTAHSEHSWKEVSHTDAAIGKPGETVFQCETCGATKTEYTPALPTPAPVEEQNGRSAYAALTVEGAAYEMHQESTRYIVTADSDTATLFGRLGNLEELKAQGADTLVFRTKSRETALDIDTMLSLGTEDTIFTLTHSGSSATLTVDGADHSELIH